MWCVRVVERNGTLSSDSNLVIEACYIRLFLTENLFGWMAAKLFYVWHSNPMEVQLFYIVLKLAIKFLIRIFGKTNFISTQTRSKFPLELGKAFAPSGVQRVLFPLETQAVYSSFSGINK